MDFAKNDLILRVSSNMKLTLASNPSDWQFSSNLIFGSDQSVGELKLRINKLRQILDRSIKNDMTLCLFKLYLNMNSRENEDVETIKMSNMCEILS